MTMNLDISAAALRLLALEADDDEAFHRLWELAEALEHPANTEATGE